MMCKSVFAPALISFAELVEHCYEAIGGREKIKVMLNQDRLQKGSFDITFLLDLDFLQEVKLYEDGRAMVVRGSFSGRGEFFCFSIH